jgi:hypothetical protein
LDTSTDMYGMTIDNALAIAPPLLPICRSCDAGRHLLGEIVDERFDDSGLILRRRPCYCSHCYNCSGGRVQVIPDENWRGQHRE